MDGRGSAAPQAQVVQWFRPALRSVFPKRVLTHWAPLVLLARRSGCHGQDGGLIVCLMFRGRWAAT